MKTHLRKFFLFALIVGLASTTSSSGQSAEEIMKQSHLTYYYAGDDGVAEVNMTIVNDKGKERSRRFAMLRLDEADGGNQKYYTYFYEPSDVQRMTFMVHKATAGSDRRWIYVPSVDLIKPIAADDKNSSFVGSHFSYEDVSGRLWTEDNHKLLREDTLGGNDVWVIESTPKQSYKGFARKVSFIDRESYLPLKEEYFNAKGELERLFTAERIEVLQEIPTVTLRRMADLRKGGYTTVEFSSIKYNLGLKDDLFTERYLKNPPREFIK